MDNDSTRFLKTPLTIKGVVTPQSMATRQSSSSKAALPAGAIVDPFAFAICNLDPPHDPAGEVQDLFTDNENLSKIINSDLDNLEVNPEYLELTNRQEIVMTLATPSMACLAREAIDTLLQGPDLKKDFLTFFPSKIEPDKTYNTADVFGQRTDTGSRVRRRILDHSQIDDADSQTQIYMDLEEGSGSASGYKRSKTNPPAQEQ